ncbi:hypothetical protein [Streptomyces sp. NBC_01476]|nr:hypothetical protein [Streptomyces sp. NBC_01476]
MNVFGDGIVHLGAVRPEAAEILARLLTAGLAMEMAGKQPVDEEPDSPAA